MSRHWGIPNVTSGAASGDQPQLRSLHGTYSTRASNVIPFSRPSVLQETRPNSERLTVAPSFIQDPIDHRNFAAWFLVAGFVLSPVVTVSIAILIYALLIA